jgi:hypothetical protein
VQKDTPDYTEFGNERVGAALIASSIIMNIVNSSFYDTDVTGQSTSVGGAAKSTLEMQSQSTYSDSGYHTPENAGV